METVLTILGITLVLLVAVAIYDVVQKQHTILRVFPIIGHFRYLLESVGPELRQYIITSNDEERPFSRSERRWIYASSKNENRFFSFGTDNDLDRGHNHVTIKSAAFPVPEAGEGFPAAEPDFHLPAAKIIGECHGRRHAFRPASVIGVSGMSYGSLGKKAVESMNRGAAAVNALHNTGEGSISEHHLHGGELIYQVGTGYFGARDLDGTFSLEQLQETIARGPVRAIEIKLSQGAKPGHGGILPAAKVTAEIAAIRNVTEGLDCDSPAHHTAFSSVDELIEFVEQIADATGLPVGIKSAVGIMDFWVELADRMKATGGGPDFITIDGGEGGTGAAPLVLADHVSLPFAMGMAQAYTAFAKRDIAEDVAFIGSGRLGLPERAVLAFSLGCDMINVGREVMFSVGCIQAQRCHTDHCPTGVATHAAWRQRGLVPDVKADRVANYITRLRSEIALLARTCGVKHPAGITPEHISLLTGWQQEQTAHEVFGYHTQWGVPKIRELEEIDQIMNAPVPELDGAVWEAGDTVNVPDSTA